MAYIEFAAIEGAVLQLRPILMTTLAATVETAIAYIDEEHSEWIGEAQPALVTHCLDNRPCVVSCPR